MELDAAQLSSLSTTLDQLVTQVTSLAERYQTSPREDVAADLFEVERSLQAAHRRMQKLVAKVS
ncbi:MAG: hypothetical protein Q8K58_15205 [Acidimicrobiales bacterium]|nr:hypothetical protein [Acidimicrobiales bacterium]